MRRREFVIALAGGSSLAVLLAQSDAGAVNLTATLANVASAPDSIRIEILRWSTDEERDRLMAAWNQTSAGGGRGAEKGAGKGAAKAGRGAAKADPNPASTPDASLAKALEEAATVGYLWSSETAGYALRYAGKVDAADGSRRIVLVTQRKLGAMNARWTPTVDGTANPYEFSVIELRLNAKGEGEGKISLTGKIAPDAAAKMVSVENYAALPAVLRDVRIRAAQTKKK